MKSMRFIVFVILLLKKIFNFNYKKKKKKITINQKGTHLATCSDSGEVKIFDLQTQKPIKQLPFQHSNVFFFFFFSNYF